MKTIILILLFLFSTTFAGDKTGESHERISVGSISFTDAVWDNVYNIDKSEIVVNDLTTSDKAVVLYFFEACFG